MLRYAIPVVVGLCGVGADRLCQTRQDEGRTPGPAVERCEEFPRERYREERCEPPCRRVEYVRHEVRPEPRPPRTWHVDIDIRRSDRDDRCEPRRR